MLWIDRVRSRAYQMPKTAASSTEKTVVLIHSGTPSWSVRMSVYRVPVDADHDDGEPVGERNVPRQPQLATVSTMAKHRREQHGGVHQADAQRHR